MDRLGTLSDWLVATEFIMKALARRLFQHAQSAKTHSIRGIWPIFVDHVQYVSRRQMRDLAHVRAHQH